MIKCNYSQTTLKSNMPAISISFPLTEFFYKMSLFMNTNIKSIVIALYVVSGEKIFVKDTFTDIPKVWLSDNEALEFVTIRLSISRNTALNVTAKL